MHMLFKIFNTLEKIASANERIIQAQDTMEKAAATVTRGLRALLKARRASIARAMRRNPTLTRQQALDAFYKRYGLQVGKGGRISAIAGAKLNSRALAKQQEWLGAMRRNKKISRDIKNLRTLDPAEQGIRLQELNKKYNFSERGGDFIVAQKPILRKGKTIQHNFRLNRKRMLRPRSKNSGPGSNSPVPEPNPPAPNPPAPGPNPPTLGDAPIGKDLLNSNWWKYGLAGAGGFLLGRTTAPEQESSQPSTYSSYQY